MSRSIVSLALGAVSVACSFVLLAHPAAAQQQSKEQQGCILGVNKALRGVAKAQGANVAACLKEGAGGASGAPINNCLTADRTGKMGKASAKTAATVAAKCASAPSFGFTDAATVNGAGETQGLALTRDIFDDVGAAVISSDESAAGAKCQASVQRSYEKILQAQIKEFEACKKAGLKAATIQSQSDLAECLDAITADVKG